MPVYEWRRDKPLQARQVDEQVEQGDVFRAPEDVGEAFGDLMEEHDDTGQAVDAEIRFNGGGDTADTTEDTAPTDQAADQADQAGDQAGDGEVEIDGEVYALEDLTLDMVGDDAQDLVESNADDVVDAVQSGDWDDRLGELEAAEAMTDDRVTVRRAIQERREEISE